MINWIKGLFTKHHRFCDKKYNKRRCIAFSICDDGSVAIDYSYDKNLEEFASLFAAIHTGKLCEPMCKLMVDNFVIENNEKKGESLMELLQESIRNAVTEEMEDHEQQYLEDIQNEDEEECPIITPTRVFMDSNDEEADD